MTDGAVPATAGIFSRLHATTPYTATFWGMEILLGVLGNSLAVSYFPSIVELGVALGIVAYALLGFTLGVRYLEIYLREQEPE